MIYGPLACPHPPKFDWMIIQLFWIYWEMLDMELKFSKKIKMADSRVLTEAFSNPSTA